MMRINPTRMELTRVKRRLVTAKRGHKLLKDKRDELVRRFVLLIRENARLREAVERHLNDAMRGFALARAVMDAQAMETAVMYPSRQAEVLIGRANILSVRVPTIRLAENTDNTTIQPYGYAETSADLDQAIETLAALLPELLRLAELEKTASLLADEIEKTRRRVNALEYVMIPQFEQTIGTITSKLDENERGAIVRLMKVKSMIADRT
ncbi:MAG: V-type ATP synthase subunit D [Clostridiales bacterium]|nr:V-type ATP synthase subunit D [Clostridiales bacterium]